MPTVPETLREAVKFLESEPVPYVLIGGLAAGLQGRPRTTEDVDLMIHVSRARIPGLARAAKQAGFRVEAEDAELQWLASGFFRMWVGDEGDRVAVDLMTSNSDFLREIVWRAQLRRFCGLDVHVASPEDLILLKLMAWREKDLADIRSTIHVAGDRLNREYLERWARWLGEQNDAFVEIPERLTAVVEGRRGPPAKQ